jgi:hypothetical protein
MSKRSPGCPSCPEGRNEFKVPSDESNDISEFFSCHSADSWSFNHFFDWYKRDNTKFNTLIETYKNFLNKIRKLNDVPLDI